MSQLQAIAERRRQGGFSLRELLRDDRTWVGCFACRKAHPLRPNNEIQDYQDFACRHPAERGCVTLKLTPEHIERITRRAERRRQRRHESLAGWMHNASVLEAFQGADQSLTITALNSLASSATAGWGSGNIDNSTNLYGEYLTAITLAAVNTAPANNKAFYVYAATALNTTDLPATGASGGVLATTQAALTFPNITTTPVVIPLLKVIPYPTINIATQTSLFSTAQLWNGRIGLQLWYAMVNFSGMTIAASGNAWKYRGVYDTVA